MLYRFFSAADVKAICEMYRLNQMNNPLTFTAGVVTGSGTQYLLKIENLHDLMICKLDGRFYYKAI